MSQQFNFVKIIKSKKIFGPRKIPIQIIGYKNNFGRTKFGSKKFRSKKVLGQKNLDPKKIVYPKKLCQKNLGPYNCRSKKLSPTKFWVKKKFKSEKCGSKNVFRSETILGP